MNLHEYQAKKILKKYDLPIQHGYICETFEEIKNAALKLNYLNNNIVLKCQVHAGGRGKVGAVKIVNNLQEIKKFSNKWLGKNLVTNQTNEKGQPVNKILVEKSTNFYKEFYLGITIDKKNHKIVAIASTEGGVEIEKIAKKTPNKIHKINIDPLLGPLSFQGRIIAYKLSLNNKIHNQFIDIFNKLVKIFIKKDLELIEINPLVLTTSEKLICLDAKMSVDNNSLYRQQELKQMHDPSQQDKREELASQHNLNYVALGGNIGCMVNGAGLAMATMDMIKLYGGKPANFLDVGGSTTEERVNEAFKIILSDKKIKSIIVNIFGGIVRCDLISEGIISSIKQIKTTIPIIIRLEGNNSDIGIKKLINSALNIIVASSLTDAAKQAVQLSKV